MLYELETQAIGLDRDRIDYLDRIFLNAADSLDLTKTQHDSAVEKYGAVGTWLDEDPYLKRFSPKIFPQGSFALGTCVKPLGRQEFDVDTTCVLQIPNSITPAALKKLVGDRLKQHGTYSGMLEEKNRCWRLNYAGEFHLDIIPAIPKNFPQQGSKLLISDKLARAWKDTDPEGYALWFGLRKRTAVGQIKDGRVQAHVAPAPEHSSTSGKAPLQIAVQILKRHRDVRFKDRVDAPISIIITTLAAHAYKMEASVIETMIGLLDRMPTFIRWIDGQWVVENPTNTEENFADKWKENPERANAFFEWIEMAKQDLAVLKSAQGVPAVRKGLIPFLGEKRADIVLNRMAEEADSLRGKGLSVSSASGAVGLTGNIVVPKNNFYGDQW